MPASSTAVGVLIVPLLKFAVVSVQMRGSGCSGGAFDLFGLPTTFGGYDAIETVAAQKWVKTLPGDGATDAWKAQPPYNWAPIAAAKGAGFATAPLPADVVIAGPSSLDLQLKSSAKDTDLQVTLGEVRPDGNETYVQNGWLRASQARRRAVDRA